MTLHSLTQDETDWKALKDEEMIVEAEWEARNYERELLIED